MTRHAPHPTLPSGPAVSRRAALTGLAAALAVPALAGPAHAGTMPTPGEKTPMGAIRNRADMLRELEKLVRTSGGHDPPTGPGPALTGRTFRLSREPLDLWL